MENILSTINQKTFYRYYPSDSTPFKVSFEDKNKYGFGIYFLDNASFYSNLYPKGNLVAILPKLKNPKVFTASENDTIPTKSYLKEYLKFINENKHKSGRNDFSEYLLKQGYDSLVIFEPRGIYLVLLKECPCLYTLLSDQPYREGGTITPHPFVSASKKEAINDLLTKTKKYEDLSDMEANILYNQFKEEDKIVEKLDVSDWIYDMLEKLLDKGYLQWDEENDSAGNWRYALDEKGKQFINAVNHRYETRYGVKKGYDLFPETANIDEYEEEFKELKEKLVALRNKLSENKVKTRKNYMLPEFFQEYDRQKSLDDKLKFGNKKMTEQEYNNLINYFKANPNQLKEDYAFILWKLHKYNKFHSGVTLYYEMRDDNRIHAKDVQTGEKNDKPFTSYADVIKMFYSMK